MLKHEIIITKRFKIPKKISVSVFGKRTSVIKRGTKIFSNIWSVDPRPDYAEDDPQPIFQPLSRTTQNKSMELCGKSRVIGLDISKASRLGFINLQYYRFNFERDMNRYNYIFSISYSISESRPPFRVRRCPANI